MIKEEYIRTLNNGLALKPTDADLTQHWFSEWKLNNPQTQVNFISSNLPVTCRALLYIGNSRWTGAGRNHAVHLANTDRQAYCGKEYKNGALDVYEGNLWEITCGECKAKYGR